MPTLRSRIFDELGLGYLLSSSRDVKLLCLQRLVRMFAYGATALILAQHLSLLGFTDARIGLFMTMTLLGDVVISFLLTLFADALGRRYILVLGSGLMAASGVMFAVSENYWLLLLASVVGVISPSGAEIGPFRAIEESTLAQLTTKDRRSDVYAWYTLIGSLGMAFGQLLCGAVLQFLQSDLRWGQTQSFKIIFAIYAGIGLIKLVFSLMLTPACEAAKKPATHKKSISSTATTPISPTGRESQPFLGSSGAAAEEEEEITDQALAVGPLKRTFRHKVSEKLPNLSRESVVMMIKLSVLLGVDSFASGLTTPSWLSYFFTRKFALAASILGTIFFVCSLISAASNLVSASLARRIGLVQTMVFTHLPSTIFLALIPAPNHVVFAAGLLALRHCTSQMDVAPRQAFISAAVLSSERTAVMGIINVIKTLAQSGGPSVTGYLAGSDKFWMAFVLAGSLKAGYDLSMLWLFVGFKPREEDGDNEAQEREHEHDSRGGNAALSLERARTGDDRIGHGPNNPAAAAV